MMDIWLNRLVILTAIVFGIFLYRKLCPSQKEHFSQKSPFILRQDNAIYDPFYIEYYDDLHATDSYCEDDFHFIKETTHPVAESSVFLDIGCGTGKLLRKMEDNGYTAFGVDKSKSMGEACKHKVDCNDVLIDPMLYDNKTFTHITCTHFTIYEMEKKETFFRHCYLWLQCGGYLIVHLVDPEKYTKVTPSIVDDISMSMSTSMVTKTNLEYLDYAYRSEYKQKETNYLFTETFTDRYTENVRQNQSTLYMSEPKQTILDLATRCGFVLYRETTYNKKIKDPHQYLVVFMKPMCGDI